MPKVTKNMDTRSKPYERRDAQYMKYFDDWMNAANNFENIAEKSFKNIQRFMTTCKLSNDESRKFADISCKTSKVIIIQVNYKHI